MKITLPNITAGSWKPEPFDTSDKDILFPGPQIKVDYDDVDHKEQRANARAVEAVPATLLALKAFMEASAVHPMPNIPVQPAIALGLKALKLAGAKIED